MGDLQVKVIDADGSQDAVLLSGFSAETTVGDVIKSYLELTQRTENIADICPYVDNPARGLTHATRISTLGDQICNSGLLLSTRKAILGVVVEDRIQCWAILDRSITFTALRELFLSQPKWMKPEDCTNPEDCIFFDASQHHFLNGTGTLQSNGLIVSKLSFKRLPRYLKASLPDGSSARCAYFSNTTVRDLVQHIAAQFLGGMDRSQYGLFRTELQIWQNYQAFLEARSQSTAESHNDLVDGSGSVSHLSGAGGTPDSIGASTLRRGGLGPNDSASLGRGKAGGSQLKNQELLLASGGLSQLDLMSGLGDRGGTGGGGLIMSGFSGLALNHSSSSDLARMKTVAQLMREFPASHILSLDLPGDWLELDAPVASYELRSSEIILFRVCPYRLQERRLNYVTILFEDGTIGKRKIDLDTTVASMTQQLLNSRSVSDRELRAQYSLYRTFASGVGGEWLQRDVRLLTLGITSRDILEFRCRDPGFSGALFSESSGLVSPGLASSPPPVPLGSPGMMRRQNNVAADAMSIASPTSASAGLQPPVRDAIGRICPLDDLIEPYGSKQFATAYAYCDHVDAVFARYSTNILTSGSIPVGLLSGVGFRESFSKSRSSMTGTILSSTNSKAERDGLGGDRREPLGRAGLGSGGNSQDGGVSRGNRDRDDMSGGAQHYGIPMRVSVPAFHYSTRVYVGPDTDVSKIRDEVLSGVVPKNQWRLYGLYFIGDELNSPAWIRTERSLYGYALPAESTFELRVPEDGSGKKKTESMVDVLVPVSLLQEQVRRELGPDQQFRSVRIGLPNSLSSVTVQDLFRAVINYPRLIRRDQSIWERTHRLCILSIEQVPLRWMLDWGAPLEMYIRSSRALVSFTPLDLLVKRREQVVPVAVQLPHTGTHTVTLQIPLDAISPCSLLHARVRSLLAEDALAPLLAAQRACELCLDRFEASLAPAVASAAKVASAKAFADASKALHEAIVTWVLPLVELGGRWERTDPPTAQLAQFSELAVAVLQKVRGSGVAVTASPPLARRADANLGRAGSLLRQMRSREPSSSSESSPVATQAVTAPSGNGAGESIAEIMVSEAFGSFRVAMTALCDLALERAKRLHGVLEKTVAVGRQLQQFELIRALENGDEIPVVQSRTIASYWNRVARPQFRYRGASVVVHLHYYHYPVRRVITGLHVCGLQLLNVARRRLPTGVHRYVLESEYGLWMQAPGSKVGSEPNFERGQWVTDDLELRNIVGPDGDIHLWYCSRPRRLAVNLPDGGQAALSVDFTLPLIDSVLKSVGCYGREELYHVTSSTGSEALDLSSSAFENRLEDQAVLTVRLRDAKFADRIRGPVGVFIGQRRGPQHAASQLSVTPAPHLGGGSGANMTAGEKFVADSEENNEIAASEVSWLKPLAIPQHEEKLVGGITLVKSATINWLIDHLVDPAGTDQEFVQAFIWTFPAFVEASFVLREVLARFRIACPAGMDPAEFRNRVLKPVQMRVCSFLKSWLTLAGDDFTPFLLKRLEDFLKIVQDDGLDALATPVLASLARIRRFRTDTMVVSFSEQAPAPKVPLDLFSSSIELVHIDDEEIARQVTLLDYQIYRAIRPSELLLQSWNKPKLMHRAPNVLEFIGRFNKLSAWVASTIVMERQLKNRVKVMTKMINLARHLMELQNFNSLMAVIAGINNAAVARLKWTRKRLSKRHSDTLADLESVMSNEFNYRTYRGRLKEVVPPCLPYLGVHLSDLVFIDDANPNSVSRDGQERVFFEKSHMIANVIGDIRKFQVPYNFQPVPRISALILEAPTIPEDEQYRISLEIEPRGAVAPP